MGISHNQEHSPNQPKYKHQNQEINTDTLLLLILRPHSSFPIVPKTSFIVNGSNPGSPAVCSCHVSLASFHMEQFLNLPSSSCSWNFWTGQDSYFVELSSLRVCLIGPLIRLRLGIFAGTTAEVMLFSPHCSSTGGTEFQCVPLLTTFTLLKVVFSRFLPCQVTLIPFASILWEIL